MENFERLQGLFNFLDRDIRYSHLTHKSDGANKEALIRQRTALREVLEKCTAIDVAIIFYLKNIERISPKNVLEALREEYRAQCKRKNLLLNTTEFFDPLLP